jgi:monoamine oxidase
LSWCVPEQLTDIQLARIGTTAVATSLANAIGSENVLVNMPVTRITQQNGTTIVTAGQNQTFAAKKVILAITPHTYAQITFSPSLPCEKNVMVARSKPGNYAKVILTYYHPWWRAAGLTGKITSLVGPIRFGWEISNPALSQYSLALFVSGDVATCWHALSGPGKEQSIIDHLAVLVGSDLAAEARNVLELNYVEWTQEKYLHGAPTSSFGPGMLRKFGPTLRQPVGAIHFAGTELAYEWKGYLEGAITSGQRAAREIVEAIGAA